MYLSITEVSHSVTVYSPSHCVWQWGRTVMVTRTGLLSFPPQSTATTDRTWLRESLQYPGISDHFMWGDVMWFDVMWLGRILSLARMYWKYHNLYRYNLDLGFSVLHQSKSVAKYNRFNILFSIEVKWSEVKWSISLSSLLTSPTVGECC